MHSFVATMGADSPPPMILVYISAYGNLFAGISLTISFFLITAIVCWGANGGEFTGAMGALQVFTMKLEGILYAVAGLALTIINVWTNNASGAVGQTIITVGGLFFFISGWGSPVITPSLKYLVPMAKNNAGVGMETVAPFYGITCFMIATAYGLYGVSSLPKNQLVSPFWGVFCFFMGAWTIGAIGSWLPLLAGGTSDINDWVDADTGDYIKGHPWPCLAWSWLNYFKIVGALFLTGGACIFAALDKVPPFCCGRRVVEPLVEGCAA